MIGYLILILLVLVVFLLGHHFGQQNLERIMRQEIDMLCEALRNVIHRKDNVRADLEALSCKRRTPADHNRNQLRAVGLEVFKDELGESKPSTDNQQAVYNDKGRPGWQCNHCTKNPCDKMIEISAQGNLCHEFDKKDLAPIRYCKNCIVECDFRTDEDIPVENCWTFKSTDTQSVTEANVEAAESVKEFKKLQEEELAQFICRKCESKTDCPVHDDYALLCAVIDNPRYKSTKKACEESIGMKD